MRASDGLPAPHQVRRNSGWADGTRFHARVGSFLGFLAHRSCTASAKCASGDAHPARRSHSAASPRLPHLPDIVALARPARLPPPPRRRCPLRSRPSMPAGASRHAPRASSAARCTICRRECTFRRARRSFIGTPFWSPLSTPHPTHARRGSPCRPARSRHWPGTCISIRGYAA
jgi:hypothetical protein